MLRGASELGKGHRADNAAAGATGGRGHAGDQAGAREAAKRVVQLREQRARMQKTKAHMSGMEMKTTTMAAQHKQVKAMGAVAGIMGKVNAQMDPIAMQKIMQEFEVQNAKMDMAQDVMDSAFDDMDDEVDAEAEAVMGQVLDQMNLELKDATQLPATRVPQAAQPQQQLQQDAAADQLPS
eukprot:Hpha_TRINITY_DN14643_c0_g1::TRINITY_DN14643_c0_g1_i4::g.47825::m.47825/K12192/CHMP2B; charged multivesicular body protein 2B